ncbi:MAG TPA: ChbG/HpnK family deacetylase [Terriglobales bacterium]|nr:ChbG/HpnK family deacetylase [Terriglobales bacterium]
MRRLIVNADDFGLTHGVNRAIAEAHHRGIVTSTTLMANAGAFDEAVLLANSSSGWSVGCHLVLVDGEPLLDPSRLPSLVPRGSRRFRDGLGVFALRALSGWLDTDQVEAEATAQIRKLQSHHLDPSHIDSHKHTHMFPGALTGMLRAARTCGVGAIRNPFEMVAANFVRMQQGLWKRRAQVRTLRGLAGGFRKAVARAGLRTPDGTLGIVATGSLDAQLFRAIAEHMPEGTWEFVCHPGYLDDDLRSIPTRLRESRERELAILTSPESRQALASRGVELISYRDL